MLRIMMTGILFGAYMLNVVSSYPNGAGGCAGNMAAVGGYHLDDSNNRTVKNGTLKEGAVQVTIGDEMLNPDTVANFTTGEDHTVTIEAIQFSIRGALIRLEAPNGFNTTASLTPTVLMKEATVCVYPVVGTTHMDNSDKIVLKSTLHFEKDVNSVILDITVVFINNPQGSVYAYSRYLVNFVPPPTRSPSQAPIIDLRSAPTAHPQTKAPASANATVVPTQAPVNITSNPSTKVTDTPGVAPPSDAPSFVPSEAPVGAPTSSHTHVPISTPTGPTPSFVLSKAPVGASTSSPSRAPTAPPTGTTARTYTPTSPLAPAGTSTGPTAKEPALRGPTRSPTQSLSAKNGSKGAKTGSKGAKMGSKGAAIGSEGTLKPKKTNSKLEAKKSETIDKKKIVQNSKKKKLLQRKIDNLRGA